MNKIRSLGIMSGTSLDGMDLALCEFEQVGGVWKYKILQTETVSYSPECLEKLHTAHKLSAQEFLKLHNQYGTLIGEIAADFLKRNNTFATIISSHGHTVFHQPDEHFTFQLGNGAYIAAASEVTTVSDFRTLDVALGGQGAPLVPIGDRILFGRYDHCINLGGFANISGMKDNDVIAYDVCPVNFVMNALAEQTGVRYDKDGEMARQGKLNKEMLAQLNGLSYYTQRPPKSLGREWVAEHIDPVLKHFNISLEDKLRTYTEHVAFQLARNSGKRSEKRILLTGGGAHNLFLVERIKALNSHLIIIPEAEIIDFKEALIFAFLGTLRVQKQKNVLSSVTGAKHDNVGGYVFRVK